MTKIACTKCGRCGNRSYPFRECTYSVTDRVADLYCIHCKRAGRRLCYKCKECGPECGNNKV
jgi:hypothetical protein